MVFPEYRPRRLRRNNALRSLIRETHLHAAQLVYPLFIMPGKKIRQEIPSMPGVFRLSIDQLAGEAKELLALESIASSCLVCRKTKMPWAPVLMPKTASSKKRSGN